MCRAIAKNKRSKFFKLHKSNGITFNKINTYILHCEWEIHFIDIMTDTLASCKHNEICLMIKPVGGFMEKFKGVANNFDKVVIHYNNTIAETLFPKVAYTLEDEIIENIKTIGNCSDPNDENYLNMLQKKELGEFINLMIHHEKELHKDSHSHYY